MNSESSLYVSTKIHLVQTSTRCSRALRCPRHSVLWPEEANVTRKHILTFPGKADTDNRCSFIRELANLNIGKRVHTTVLTFTPSWSCVSNCMLPACRPNVADDAHRHDDAATFCSSFATVPRKDGRFALHTHTRCCAQSFMWDSYDI